MVQEPYLQSVKSSSQLHDFPGTNQVAKRYSAWLRLAKPCLQRAFVQKWKEEKGIWLNQTNVEHERWVIFPPVLSNIRNWHRSSNDQTVTLAEEMGEGKLHQSDLPPFWRAHRLVHKTFDLAFTVYTRHSKQGKRGAKVIKCICAQFEQWQIAQCLPLAFDYRQITLGFHENACVSWEPWFRHIALCWNKILDIHFDPGCLCLMVYVIIFSLPNLCACERTQLADLE